MKSEKYYYAVVCVLLIFEKLTNHTNFLMLLIVCISGFLLLLKKITFLDVCMVGLTLPGGIWVLSMLLISLGELLIRKKNIIIPTCHSKIKLSLSVIIIFAILNVIHSGGLINTLFYSAYLFFVLFFALAYKKNIHEDQLYKRCIILCWIQFILTFLEIFLTKSVIPGDNYYGSLKDAHEFGVWLLFMLTFMGYHFKSEKHSKKRITLHTDFACLLMLYLADAKHVIFAYIAGLFLYIILKIFKIKKNVCPSMLAFSILMFYI